MDDAIPYILSHYTQEEDKGKVKQALDALKLEGVSEVVGLQELRTDYKQYQERRKLRDGK